MSIRYMQKRGAQFFLLKDMHSMRVVPREIELIRPVPEYSQYSETGFFCASNERSSKQSLPGSRANIPRPGSQIQEE